MASEDVIELGSSDEDTSPASKQVIAVPNAMVHIPSKYPGITVKATNKGNNINPLRKLIGKSVTVTKIKPSTNIKNKQIKSVSKASLQPARKQNLNNLKIQNYNEIKKANLPIRTPKLINIPGNVMLPKTKYLSPQVTMSKVTSKPIARVPIITNVISMNKKKPVTKITPKRVETMTVNIDDEEPPSQSKTGPLWYLTPEETSEKNMEQVNNAEPSTSNFIEITIDDSPFKPGSKRKMSEIGTELPITIEDSPIKHTSKKFKKTLKNKPTHKITPSKKQLNYPQATDHVDTIEIELEPLFPLEADKDVASADADATTENNDDKSEDACEIVDITELPEANADKSKTDDTPKKVSSQEPTADAETVIVADEDFHPAYKEFIDLCLKIEDSNDMKTIVEKKIKSYYRQVPKKYTESEEFIELVQGKISTIKSDPQKLYLYIKDIVDELNLQRKMAKAYPPTKEKTRDIEAEKFQYGENSEFDSTRQRQIRKLEKTLKKLHRAIQKLEEQEVDFEDEEDSVYLLTERYKERMVRVHAKFCQLTNTKMPSEPRIQIDPRPGQPAGPAKRLEKWVNKKVPIGKPLPFPDFHDVLRCVREANEEDKLGLNEADIVEEARDLFTRCGKKLQRRRQENEWRLATSRLSLDVDPAENSEELKKKLESNLQVACKKEAEIFNKFADKQNQMKLEAVEIGDKEAEESPVESEDDADELSDGISLETKEKRKERLRRLLHDKSKQINKENQSEEQIQIENQCEETSNVQHKENVENDVSEKSVLDTEVVCKESENIDNEKIINVPQAEKPSDGDYNIDSDVDELHLLEKLHSDEIISSSFESSENESIAGISDNLHSGSEKGKINSDVISIEDSSYSDSNSKEVDEKDSNKMEVDKEILVENITLSPKGSVENILLGSSEEDTNSKNCEGTKNDDCVNLQDDSISIGETMVQHDEAAHVSKDHNDLTSNNNNKKGNNDTIILDSEESCLIENNRVEDRHVKAKKLVHNFDTNTAKECTQEKSSVNTEIIRPDMETDNACDNIDEYNIVPVNNGIFQLQSSNEEINKKVLKEQGSNNLTVVNDENSLVTKMNNEEKELSANSSKDDKDITQNCDVVISADDCVVTGDDCKSLEAMLEEFRSDLDKDNILPTQNSVTQDMLT